MFHTEEKRNITYLTQEFNLVKATIREAIKSLKEKGLITKSTAPKDKRLNIINLTEEGKRIAREVSNFSQDLQSVIQTLSTEEQEQFFASLVKIIRLLNQAGVLTIQRMCFSCQFYK